MLTLSALYADDEAAREVRKALDGFERQHEPERTRRAQPTSKSAFPLLYSVRAKASYIDGSRQLAELRQAPALRLRACLEIKFRYRYFLSVISRMWYSPVISRIAG